MADKREERGPERIVVNEPPPTVEPEAPLDPRGEPVSEPEVESATESEPTPEPEDFRCRFCRAVLGSRAELRAHEDNFHPAKGKAREERAERFAVRRGVRRP